VGDLEADIELAEDKARLDRTLKDYKSP